MITKRVKQIISIIVTIAILVSIIPESAISVKAGPDDGTEIVLSEESAFDISFLWIDNDTTHRPDVTNNITVSFTIAGNDKVYEYNQENAVNILGMSEKKYKDSLNFRKKSDTGTIDTYEISLPTVYTVKTTTTDEDGNDKISSEDKAITWTLSYNDVEAAGNDFYLPVNQATVNLEGVEYENIWIYREQSKCEFNLDIKQGANDTVNAESFMHSYTDGSAEGDSAIHLYARINGAEKDLGPINAINTAGAFDYINFDNGAAAVAADSDKYTINNLPKYDDDKIEIIYYMRVNDENVYLDDSGDYYRVKYNNDASPNFGSNTTQCHNLGKIEMLLSGSTDYDAKKLWLDNNATNRPTTVFNLWRYTKKGDNPSYQQASRSDQVKDKYVKLSGDANIEEIYFDGLDKYDPEGYEYVYITREDVNYDNYEIVYLTGYEEADGQISSVTEDTGRNGDNSIYDDGIVANRIKGTTTINWRKEWKAAYYQDKLSNVNIHFGIKRRMQGSDGEWTDTDKDIELSGFIAESLYREGTIDLPLYDELGRPLEYMFYEKSILENGSERPLTDGIFNLGCNENPPAGDTEHFESVMSGVDNNKVIVNKLVGTTTYEVDKVWAEIGSDGKPTGNYGKTAPKADAKVTVQLYQNGSEFGTPVELNGDNTYKYSYENLPKFDADGKAYNYIAYEESSNVSNWSSITKYDVKNDDDTITDCRIYNAPVGGPVKYIWIQKEWKDDGNEISRKPVTVEVYREKIAGETEDKYLATYTLDAKDNWRKKINVSEYTNESKSALVAGTENANYYIREVCVGDSSTVVYDCYNKTTSYNNTNTNIDEQKLAEVGAPVMFNGSNNMGATVDRITTADKKMYEAYYTQGTLEGLKLYTVVNRRVGFINYNITKKWLDGESESRPDNDAKFHLYADSSDGYSHNQVIIEDNSGQGTVTIKDVVGFDGKIKIKDNSNNQIGSIQSVSNVEGNTYYFNNLPKYDSEGRVLHYMIKEEDIPAPYVPEYSALNYSVEANNDIAAQTITNKRVDVKTVSFNKAWRDEAVFKSGRRPDIYLNLYKKNNKNGELVAVDPYPKRNWKMTDEYNWICEFPNVDKYDDEGREIEYYVTEGSSANMASLDYAPVEAQSFVSENTDGTNNYADIASGDLKTVAGAPAIPENGRFINRLQGTAIINGKKVWKNVPAGTPLADLPILKIKVNRTNDGSKNISDYEEKDVAYKTILDMNSSYSGFECNFEIKQTKDGKNLPKYDEDGKFYYYTVVEAVVDSKFEEIDGTKLSDLELTTYEKLPGDVNDFVITNVYSGNSGRGKNIGYLKAVKNWAGIAKADLDSGKYVYPAVQFKLYRQYLSNDTDSNVKDGMTKPVLVESAIVTSGKNTSVEKVFTPDKLLLYAPNGNLFYYYVEETILNGYDTTVSDTSSTSRSASFTLKDTTKDTVKQITFNNEYTHTETISIKGKKVWDDYDNATQTRPKDLTVTVYRYADAQKIDRDTETEDAGSANAELGKAIAEEKVDSGNYTIIWDKDSSTGEWSYTITGLTRYAPNGMPWKYVVKEETVNIPKYYTVVDNDAKAKKDSDYDKEVVKNANVVEMKNLKNTVCVDATLTKTWTDDNSTNLRPKKISVKLQYKVGDTADSWKDVTTANLIADGFNIAAGSAVPFTTTYDIDITGKETKFTSKKDLPGTVDKKKVHWRFVETAIGSGSMPVEVTDDSKVTGGSYKDNIEYKLCGSFQPSQTEWSDTDGTKLKNELTSISLEVEKKWEDYENIYNTRPASITLTLQRYLKTSDNGEPAEENWVNATDVDGKVITAVINSKNNWKYEFKDLRLHGKEKNSDDTSIDGTYIYRVVESTTDLDGYAASYNFDKSVTTSNTPYKTTITNTLSPVTTLNVTKVWKDTAGQVITDNTGKKAYFEVKKVKKDDKGKDVVSSFTTPKIVELDGTKDDIETTAWTATITNLPTLTGVTYKVVEVYKNADNNYVEGAPSGYWKTESIEEDSSNTTANPKYNATITNNQTYISLIKLASGNTAITTDYKVSYDIMSGDTKVATWSKTKASTEYSEALTNVNEAYNVSLVEQAKVDGVYMPAKIAGLPIGSYTLVEAVAPNGYKKASNVSFTIKSDGKVYIGDKEQDNNLIKLNDAPITVGIEKINADKNDLSSADSYAKFDVTGKFADNSSTEVTKSISTQAGNTNTTSISTLDGLWIAGETYTFTETQAPNGYIKSSVSVKVSIAANGNVTVSDGTAVGSIKKDTTSVLQFKNDPISVNICKYAVKGDADVALKNAKFILTDTSVTPNTTKEVTIPNTTGKLVLKGTDTTVPMVQGHIYTLKETTAPDGYLLSADGDGNPDFVVTFKVTDGGKIDNYSVAPDSKFSSSNYLKINTDKDTLSIKNDPIVIEIEKYDASTNLLSGSKFKLTDKNDGDKNKVVELTDGKIVLSGNDASVPIIQNHTYTLEETVAPSGYTCRPAITFVINNQGRIVAKTGSSFADYVAVDNSKSNAVISIHDKKTEIKFNKTDEADASIISSELKLSVYKKDTNETLMLNWKHDDNGYAISDVNTSVSGMVAIDANGVISGLPSGNYELRETGTPSGYETSPNVSFTINPDGTIVIPTTSLAGKVVDNTTVVMKDYDTEVKLIKDDSKGSPIAAKYGYAEFEVTGIFKGDTTAATVTITTEPGKTNSISTYKGKWIVGNTYIFKETKAPNGYVKSDKTVSIKIEANGSITVSSDEGSQANVDATNKDTLHIKNKTIQIKLIKQTASGNALTGSQFKLTDEDDGNKNKTITIGNDGQVLSGTDSTVPIVQGHNYLLEEVTIPNGYYIPGQETSIKFKVNESGKVELSGKSGLYDGYVLLQTNDTDVVVKNAKTEIKIEKWDSRGTKLSDSNFTFEITGDFVNTTGKMTVHPDDVIKGDFIVGKTYTIKETKVKNGYSNAGSATFTVGTDGNITTTDNTAVTSDGNVLKITNVYSASGSFTPEGTKTLTGRAYNAGEKFEYEVFEGSNVVSTGSNTADGPITFEPITYALSDVGTHTYVIKEKEGIAKDIIYDDSTFEVVVTVEDKGDGTLNVTSDYKNGDVSFENVYKAAGNFTPEGTKTLTGRAYKAGEKFKYEVLEGDNVVSTGSNTEDGAIKFKPVLYEVKDAGKHTYVIKEKAGKEKGISYDDKEYTVEVNVTDKGDGTLDVAADYKDGAINFTNVYTASGSFTPAGNKELTGRAYKAGEKFEYEVLEGSNVVSTGNNTENGAITFTPVTYNVGDIGIHTYVISEKAGTEEGLSYDDKKYTVEVNVTDNGDGTLNAVADYKDGDANFTNIYSASGSITFTGSKILTGREYLNGEKFTYKVFEGINVVATGESDSTGIINFTPIIYNEGNVGKHKYIVKEDAGTSGGITYDSSQIELSINVKDDGKGNLTAEAAADNPEIKFENVYKANGVFTPVGNKTLTGRAYKAGEKFEYEVLEGSNVVSTGSNTANGAITFKPVTYSVQDIGTHTYVISEKAGKEAGLSYDDRKYTVEVNVTDNSDGSLNVTADYKDGGADFVNVYSANGSFTPEGTKILTGRDYLEGETFEYVVKEGENVVSTGTNSQNGDIAFEQIQYTLNDVGRHVYTITETAGEASGLLYDDTVYTVTVDVTDTTNGTLEVVADKEKEDIQFENVYGAVGYFTPEGTKQLTGRQLISGEFSFEVYEVIADATGNEEEKLIQTVANDEAGNIPFKKICYTEEQKGTHTYKIKEVNNNIPGVTYDKTVYTVVVEVVDQNDGNCVCNVSYDNPITFVNEYNVETAKWKPEGTKVLKGRDYVNGETFNYVIKEGDTEVATGTSKEDGIIEFESVTYGLSDIGEHHYTISEINDEKSGIRYDSKVYNVDVVVSDKGDGTLSVQVNSDEPQIVFTNKYHATGEVVVEGVKNVKYNELSAFKFSVYSDKECTKPAKGSELKKSDVLSSRKDGSFNINFNYTEESLKESGKYLSEKQFVYYIKENDPRKYYAHDEAVYKVTVTVKNNTKKGVIDTNVKLEKKSKGKAFESYKGKLKFVNEYQANGKVQFVAEKTLTGNRKGTIKDKEFEFVAELVGNNGSQQQKKVSGFYDSKYRGVVFDEIEFTAEDIDKEFIYKVTEVPGTDKSINYSKEAYYAKVSVVKADINKQDGKLACKVKYYKDSKCEQETGKIEFTNEYKAAGYAEFENICKQIDGKKLYKGEFEFYLKNSDNKIIGKAKNDAKGNVKFDKITFTEEDINKTYTYYISERNTNKSGIVYDKTQYIANVKVSDNGDGTLNCSVTYKEGSQNRTKLVFKNKYVASGSWIPRGTKELVGRDFYEGEKCIFEVREGNKVVAKGTCSSNGNIDFETVNYSVKDVGQHVYNISEVAGDDDSVEYDTNVYTVNVSVTDNGKGHLSVNANYNSMVAFRNIDVNGPNTADMYNQNTDEGENNNDDSNNQNQTNSQNQSDNQNTESNNTTDNKSNSFPLTGDKLPISLLLMLAGSSIIIIRNRRKTSK